MSLADPLDGVEHARRYWEGVFAAGLAAGDQDVIDGALAEKRALTRLALQLIYPPTRGGNA